MTSTFLHSKIIQEYNIIQNISVHMEKTVQGIMVGRDRNRYRSISPRKQYDTTQKQNDNNANIYVYKED